MTETGLQVAVGTISRFHSFDLALELQKRHILTAIYTGYPKWNLGSTGIESDRLRTFPWVMAPYMGFWKYGLMKYVPPLLKREWEWVSHETLDRHIARNLVDCDVYTCLSGIGLYAGKVAQSRGAAYVSDRGSTHILHQDRILREEADRVGIPFVGVDPRVIEKEREEFEIADAITVSHSFAKETFVREGIEPEKIRVIPYGANMDLFRPCAERSKKFRILFVGQLSIRKGLHYLLQAFQLADLPDAELVLVGSPQPETQVILDRYPVKNVELTGSVPKAEVARQMSMASVFVLASVEDGMATVQVQALACGCPIITTETTGGADLFTEGKEGYVVPLRDPESIAKRLVELYEDRPRLEGMSDAALERVKTIGGWADYGNKSEALFRELAEKR